MCVFFLRCEKSSSSQTNNAADKTFVWITHHLFFVDNLISFFFSGVTWCVTHVLEGSSVAWWSALPRDRIPQLNTENVIYVNYFRSYKDKTCLLNIFYGHISFNYQFSQLNPYQWVFERTQVQISSVTTFHRLNTLAAKIAAKIASVNGPWEFTFLSFSVANTTRTLKAGRETAWQIPSSKQF